ncbi:zinc finger protein 675-like isoform X2 [Stomoxys calcitrans]|nr:zinc finger protein 675-like isoform X2 [Stomoxys calcitrans]
MCSENIKCRCCFNPSVNLFKLSAKSRLSGVEEKTYSELLQEVTSSCDTNIFGYEVKIPQTICRKCANQLKNVYQFILQTRKVYEHYLRLSESEGKDLKPLRSSEDLEETLIEIQSIKVVSDVETLVEEVKIEKANENDLFPADTMEAKSSDYITEDNEFSADGEDMYDYDVLEDSSNERQQKEMTKSDSCTDEDQSVDEEDMMSFEPIAIRCDVCQKIYRDERALNIHKRYTHMPEEEKIPCPCPGCDYKTSRLSALKVHTGLSHGAEKFEEYFKQISVTGKKFLCDLCCRGYQRREDLSKHFRKKHRNPGTPTKRKKKPNKTKEESCFLCASCGQSYNSKKALDGHLLSHTVERPFRCDLCEKTFKRMKDLNTHRVIHSDEKPFQCSNCGKSFKRADKLKIHMRVHSELRPYQCEHCEKTFKYPSVLRTHMHMHTGQTPFSCKTCGEAFSVRTSLNNHCLKNGHVK